MSEILCGIISEKFVASNGVKQFKGGVLSSVILCIGGICYQRFQELASVVSNRSYFGREYCLHQPLKAYSNVSLTGFVRQFYPYFTSFYMLNKYETDVLKMVHLCMHLNYEEITCKNAQRT